MISDLFLLAASMALFVLAGINLEKCITEGAASAYGREYARADAPFTFWVSAISSGLGLLMGTVMAFAAVVGLTGR